MLPVTGRYFRTAAKFVDYHTLGLRAGDALHLATASEHGATVGGRYFSGKNSSATASCSGTSGKKLSRWQ